MGRYPQDSEASCFGRAIAEALRKRHPFHTAKLVATDLDCTKKAAENLLAGHLSARSITRVVQVYGWALIIEATTSARGQSLEDYIEELQVEILDRQRRINETKRGIEVISGRLLDKASHGRQQISGVA